MTKRFTYVVAGLALTVSASISAEAVMASTTSPRSREEIAQLRASRQRTAKAPSVQKAPVQAGDKSLYGVVYATEDGGMWGFYGPVQVSDRAANHTVLSEFDMEPFSGVYFDGKYLQSFYNSQSATGPVTYVVYDAETWQPLTGNMSFMSSTGVTSDILPYGLTYDHTTGKIFGCFYAHAEKFAGTDDAQFGYFDLDSPLDPVTIINRELPERMRTLATDYDGQVYGFGQSGQLYTINKLTGEATPTGVSVELISAEGDASFGFASLGRESIAVDWETGDFYMSYSDDMWDSYIGRFNPAVGDVTVVADYSYLVDDWNYGDRITGLFFKQHYATQDVIPALVSNLSVSVPSTALVANVTFTMPTVDTNGDAISGEMDWYITDGTNHLTSGKAQAGETVNTEVTVLTPGFCSLAVYTSLNGKDSAPTTDRQFFGPDTPVIWGTPTVRGAGNKLTVQWTAAYSANGGNLDPVTYKVTRMPDNVVVAEACEAISFVDEIDSDIKTKYYYTVQPFGGEVAGEAVESRALYFGEFFALPHRDTFEDQTLLLEYPIIDNNNDNVYWDYSTRKNEVTQQNGVAMIQTNPSPDDYLLIGPFKMTAGSSYTFQMAANCHNTRELIDVWVGTDPNDVKSFDTQIIEPTTLNSLLGMKSLSSSFEPTESGNYYFGIHACTEGTGQYIYLYEVNVKEAGADSPAMPSDVDAIPGAKSAEIRFTLPTTMINGSALTELVSANIYRDGELIGTLTEGVAPGAQMSFTDNDEVNDGFHTYSVVAVSAQGEGKSAQVQLYRGLDFPGKPTALRFWEDLETPGLMHVTFNHPERGYYGGYVNPDEIWYLVDYLVMGASSGVIDLGYGTEATFQLPYDVKAQDIFAGSVYGRNSKGVIANSTNWTTSTAYIGEALPLPLHESWPGQTQKSGIWGGQSVEEDAGLFETYWDIRDGSLTAAHAQDNDNGMLAIDSEVDGGGKRVLSPRVTLQGAENPTLRFYYRYTTDALDFRLEAFVDDKPVSILQQLDLSAANANTWQRVEVNLNQFKDCKYIQFGFTAYGNKSQEFVCIDNVNISDLVDHDLSVTSFTVPTKADVNSEVEITLGVRNNGGKDVDGSDYTVKFYKNGEFLEEIEGEDMVADSETTFSVIDVPTVTDPTSTDYYAEIVYADDAKPEDNISSRGMLRIVIADYPTVTDLKAQNGRGVELTWSDPDMTTIPGVSVTESFETYEAFIIDNIGDWTLYDGDASNTIVLATSLGVLDYPHIGEPMAWQVMNPDAANILLSAWFARSGSNLLASYQASSNYCDDWLISPELNGSEQVISFYSRAGNGGVYAPELFDFMVSSKTNAISDFTPMATSVEVPYTSDEWVEYTYRVPAGTRFFAIVHKSYGKVAMLVDDITYIPAGSSPVQLDLQGFNVYRDGKRLNSEPVADNSWNDLDVEDNHEYSYNVTPVYDKGEAGLSNTVTILAQASIDQAVSYQLTISGIEGAVRVEGGIGENVAVYTPAGVCVAVAKAEGTVEIAVPAGIYLVKAGNAVAKIAVR